MIRVTAKALLSMIGWTEWSFRWGQVYTCSADQKTRNDLTLFRNLEIDRPSLSESEGGIFFCSMRMILCVIFPRVKALQFAPCELLFWFAQKGDLLKKEQNWLNCWESWCSARRTTTGNWSQQEATSIQPARMKHPCASPLDQTHIEPRYEITIYVTV